MQTKLACKFVCKFQLFPFLQAFKHSGELPQQEVQFSLFSLCVRGPVASLVHAENRPRPRLSGSQAGPEDEEEEMLHP